jgi:hypothetical protein
MTCEERPADEGRAEEITAGYKDSTAAGVARDVLLQAMPTLSTAATQLSFVAAGNQFNALTRFGSEAGDAASTEYRTKGVAQSRNEYERIFLRDRVVEINANGLVPGVAEYIRAVNAIRAKAVALGYGAQAQSVPITSVPGGYVGRFGGHDIYAAAN